MSRTPSSTIQDTRSQIQKVFSEWCTKATAVILAARFPDQGSTGSAARAASAGVSLTPPSFNFQEPGSFDLKGLELARPEFFGSDKKHSQRTFLVEICSGQAPDAQALSANSGSCPPNGSVQQQNLLKMDDARIQERWCFNFVPLGPDSTGHDRHNHNIVRKLSVTLRTLLCFTRTLPADAACRNGPLQQRFWQCRLVDSAEAAVFPGGSEWVVQEFASVQSTLGSLRLSVAYRGDLKWKWSAAAEHAATDVEAGGSQLDDIEVEEGYVMAEEPAAAAASAVAAAAAAATSSSAIPSGPSSRLLRVLGADSRTLGTPPLSAKSSPRYSQPALDKIAEEPEMIMQNGGGGLPVSARAAAGKGVVEAGSVHHAAAPHRVQRPRSYSNASDTSTMSTSSRGPSMPDHAVVLGSTPPFAAASLGSSPPMSLISLGPPLRSESAPSSRSTTPHSTPKLEPSPDPLSAGLSLDHSMDRRSRPSARAAAAAAFSAAAAAATVLGGAGPAAARAAAATARVDVQEHPLEPFGGSSTPARPVSPTLQQGIFDDLSDIWTTTAVERGRRRTSTSPRSVDARSLSQSREGSIKAFSRMRSPQQEPETEIFYFGMSDEENSVEAQEEEEGESSENVVAQSIPEGAGAFVLGGGACWDAEDLGLTLETSSLPVGTPPPSSSLGVSPLIAQLNPLVPLSGASTPVLGPSACLTEDAKEVNNTTEPDLLGEMGELMVKLQQKPELVIASQEVSIEELFDRLDHFREVSNSTMMRREL